MFRRRASAGKIEPAVRDDGEQTSVTERPGPAAPDSDEPAEPWGAPPAGLDVSVPHPARVWNYWLGGRDFFAADKAAGEEISRDFPHLAEAARAERAFLVRAVRFLAGPARIRQFLDVGAGLPAGGNTHEIAQSIAPDAGIVYADNDPVVILHAEASTFCSLSASWASCWAARRWQAGQAGRSATPTPTCVTWPRCWPPRPAPSTCPGRWP